ncbi:E3 SUMO-protein ligase KIAA1586, partial [Dissostichus eleginoides]
MKKELLKKIIETKSKITVLADESTSFGHKSTLIVFLKASVDGDMEPIAFPLDLSPKNMRQLSQCAHNLDIALRRIGKVFSVRWVASSWRAVSAVWQSYPALPQHFREASEDDTRDSRERAKIQRTEDHTPKGHDIMTMYVKRIESFNRYPAQHAVDASQAEEVMEFKGEELRVGRSPIIDSAQFIRAVADNMKERLFTTTANRAQASVAANRKEAITALSIKWQSSTLTTGTMTILDLEIMSSVGPPCRQWDPLPYVKTWLGKGRRAAHSTSCMARR